MPEHKGNTNEVTKVELPSAIEQVRWTQPTAAVGSTAGLEVYTHYVGDGAALRIELVDGRGRALGTADARIVADRYRGKVIVPPAAEGGLVVKVSLPNHGLSKDSALLLLLPAPTITNAKWSAAEARRGDILTLTAEVTNVPDGTEAEIAILEHDADGAHDLVTRFPALVQSGKVKAEWEFEYHEDTDDIPTEEESERGYAHPEYFFRAQVRGVEAESGLLRFKDWVEINAVDALGNPIPNLDYVLYLPDGAKREGRLDERGTAREMDVPPGKTSVEFLNIDELDLPAASVRPTERGDDEDEDSLEDDEAPPETMAEGASPLQEDDEYIVIKLDCGGYPTDEAPLFNMELSTERWEVRTVSRRGGETRELEKQFMLRYADGEGINEHESELLKDLLGFVDPTQTLPRSSIELKRMIDDRKRYYREGSASMEGVGKRVSYQISYHHLKPTWAGGTDDPSNLWPVEPGHKPVGIHEWWNSKLKTAIEEQGLSEILLDTDSEIVNIENRMSSIAKRCRSKYNKKLIVEIFCPEAASSA